MDGDLDGGRAAGLDLSLAPIEADLGPEIAKAVVLELVMFHHRRTGAGRRSPFGGVKRSGYGRELSQLDVKEFMNQKLVLVINADWP